MSLDAQILALQDRLAYLETLPGGEQTGSFTPTFFGDGTAGVFTYAIQAGTYVRRGSLVYVAGRVSISAIGTPPVGSMYIIGLPFAAAATYIHAAKFAYISNFNNAVGAVQLLGLINAGAASIQLYESFDNGPAVAAPAANFVNTSTDIIFSATYKCA
jgi:hypothetical protein